MTKFKSAGTQVKRSLAPDSIEDEVSEHFGDGRKLQIVPLEIKSVHNSMLVELISSHRLSETTQKRYRNQL